MTSQMKAVIWDVQHGSSTHILTPSGKNIVIDLGVGDVSASDERFSPLKRLKYKLGGGHLDAVIITHPHRDHIDDIFNFDLLPPSHLVRPAHLTEQDIRSANQSKDKEVVEKYLEISSRYRFPVDDFTNPLRAGNNGGVAIECFVPSSSSSSNINNSSVVTVVSFAGRKMLIPGDNEPESWHELLSKQKFRDAISGTDVLVAPHHGRQSGYSSELFTYIAPRLTIISDGPSCDTSATSRYGEHTAGWTVSCPIGERKVKKCISTRDNGTCVVKFGTSDEGKCYLSVIVDNF